ncbi:MAG TPA: beta-propeller fold lactonase family protein [Bryobacteraceae bacterium]|nr:beta-propeller fold lactonase family protein [Bryobacteraceae bacterium]
MKRFSAHSTILSTLVVLILTGCSKPTTTTTSTTSPSSSTPVASLSPSAAYGIYVSDEISGDLTVIDPTTFTVVTTVHLGKRPRGIHARPDGKTIYVALSGSPPEGPGVDESNLPPPDKSADGIGVFDVATNKLVRVMQAGSDPENFAVSQDGKTIYVSNEDASGISFVDVAQGKVTQTIRTGDEPEGVTITPDGKLVYSTSEDEGTLAVINPDPGKLLKTFKVGRRPRNIVFMPDGKHGYVNAENDGAVVLFDAVKNLKQKEISLGKPGQIKPMGLALSSDGSKLYVTTGRAGKVFVVDTGTNKPIASFEVGKRPWGIALSPDGKTLFTANGPSNDVTVVDVASQTVTKKISVPGGPWGVIAVKR